MKNWNIRKRVLFLAIFPTLLIALTLSSYFSYAHITHIEDSLIEKGQLIANHLAPACEYGVFSENISILENLLNSTFNEKDVINVTVTDKNNQAIISKNKNYTSNKFSNNFISSFIENKQYIFKSEIKTTVIPDDGLDELFINNKQKNSGQTETLGYVYVTLSSLSTRSQQLDSLLKGLLLTFTGLILTIFLAFNISRSVVKPIQNLTQAVRKIKRGELDSRVETISGGELGMLEDGVNKMAEEIQNVRSHLQHQVDIATASLKKSLENLEIQNIELDLSRAQAISSSQIKSEFLANMSHEIRTPMNGILGFSELLMKSSLNNEQKDFVETIRTSASNLITIINDILDFSKIESGKLGIEKISFSLVQLMDELINMCAPMAYKKGIELICHPYPDIPENLNGDPHRIRQVILNLLSNAIKFTSTGYVSFRLIVVKTIENRYELRFIILDTGIGMDEKSKQRLFTAFTQADTSISRQFGGTGLGLVISQKLANLMHGEIGFESDINKGSTFWFSIPLQARQGEINFYQRKYPVKIALYDAHEESRISCRNLLNNLGISTLESSKLNKISIIISENKDIVAAIFCLNRKQIQDNIFINKLHNEINNISLPCLVMSSSYEEYDLELLHHKHIDNIIHKCSRHSDLIQTIENLISKEHHEIHHQHDIVSTVDAHMQGLKVLLVDDNEINIKLAYTLLKERGINVDTAEDGNEAIKLAEQYTYDLIFMDIHMPHIDGFQATQAIRKLSEKNKNTSIIALTANAMPEEQLKAYDCGMNDILIKPITSQQLFDILDRWIHKTSEKPVKVTESIEKTSDTSCAYDKAESIKLAGGNMQLANELFNMLINELSGHRQSLIIAFNNNDLEAMKHSAHKLHGASSYCGVPALRIAANELELVINNNDDVLFEDAFNSTIREIDRLLEGNY